MMLTVSIPPINFTGREIYGGHQLEVSRWAFCRVPSGVPFIKWEACNEGRRQQREAGSEETQRRREDIGKQETKGAGDEESGNEGRREAKRGGRRREDIRRREPKGDRQ